MFKQLLELFLQRFRALTPEVSFLLAVVTTVVSPFSIICHPDGGCIDLGVEGQLHIFSVLRGIVVINVRQDVVLFSFNFHGRLYLCSVDGNIGTIVVLSVVTCLVLMTIIRPPLVWICVVSSVRGLARRRGVCLSLLCPSAPMVLNFILFTLLHSNEYVSDAGLGVISLVDHHGLVLWMQPVEEGILCMIFHVSRLEHIVVKLLKFDS